MIAFHCGAFSYVSCKYYKMFLLKLVTREIVKDSMRPFLYQVLIMSWQIQTFSETGLEEFVTPLSTFIDIYNFTLKSWQMNKSSSVSTRVLRCLNSFGFHIFVFNVMALFEQSSKKMDMCIPIPI